MTASLATEPLTPLDSANLIPAMEANMEAAFRLFAVYGENPDVIDRPEILCYASGIAHPLANGVARTRLSAAQADEQLPAIIDWFAAKQVPFTWFLNESSTPVDLGKRITEHGLVAQGTVPAMAIDLALLNYPDAPRDGIETREASSEQELAEWSRVAVKGSGVPDEIGLVLVRACLALGGGEASPLRLFVGYRNGMPAATSALTLASGVAGIYCVATLPDSRRVGMGSAVTVAALCAARGLGYRVATLQSSAMGRPIYERLGFRELFSYLCFTGDAPQARAPSA